MPGRLCVSGLKLQGSTKKDRHLSNALIYSRCPSHLDRICSLIILGTLKLKGTGPLFGFGGKRGVLEYRTKIAGLGSNDPCIPTTRARSLAANAAVIVEAKVIRDYVLCKLSASIRTLKTVFLSLGKEPRPIAGVMRQIVLHRLAEL